MKFALTLSILFISFIGLCQESKRDKNTRKTLGFENDELLKLKDRQNLSESFFDFTKFISNPSTISIFGTDIHKVTEASLNKKMFVLNADIQTPIFIGGKRGYILSKKDKQWFHSLHVIPRFKVRILNEDKLINDKSLPVRTPSYMPGIKYYTSFADWYQPERGEAKWLSMAAYHHSDGQYNDEFFAEDFLSNPDFATSPYKSGDINVFDGNFSEMVVFEFGYGYSSSNNFSQKESWSFLGFKIPWAESNRYAKNQMRLDSNKLDEARPIFNWSNQQKRVKFAELAIELHPRFSTNEEYLKRKVYGTTRLNYSWNSSNIILQKKAQKVLVNGKTKYESTDGKEIENSRLNFSFSYILDGRYNKINSGITTKINWFDFSKRANIVATKYFRMPGTTNSAFFIQSGYYGSDPYNVYFGQSAFILRGGLSFLYFNQGEIE